MRTALFIYGRNPLGGVSPAYSVPLIILAIGIGAVAAMLGIGGGLLTVPMLMIIFGFSPVIAAGTGAVTTMVVGIFTTISQHRYGDADYRKGMWIAGSAIPAAFLGSYASNLVPGNVLMLVLSALMLLSAWRLLSRVPELTEDISLYYYLILGGGAGFIAGLVGIGGGVLFVPMLILTGMRAHQATSTSSFVIMFSGTAAAIGHLVFGHVDLVAAGLIGIGIIPGTYLGVGLARSMDEDHMKKAIGGFLILVALKLVLSALSIS